VGIEAVRAVLLLVAACALFQALPLAGAGAHAPGRELIAEHELPAEHVAQLRAQALAAQSPSARAWTEPRPWIGPVQPAGSGRNPYTLVVRASGVALAAGDVRTKWYAGWEVQESASAARELLLPLAGLSSGSVKAGTQLTLTAVGIPVSFRGERAVAPMINLVAAPQFELQTVRVAVWSGPAPWVTREPLTSTHGAALLLGLLCGAVWFALRRPAHGAAGATAMASAATATPTVPPSLPPQALPPLLPASPPPPAAVATPQVAQTARVAAALAEVLGAGLTVVTEFDESRRPPRRRRRGGLTTG
jgi:hypothetical protein